MSKKPYYITTAIAYTSGKPILVTHMRLFQQMQLQDLREKKAMMYVSRQEQMNMVRKSS